MWLKRLIPVISMCCAPAILCAQSETLNTGVLPEASLNFKLKNGFAMNTKAQAYFDLPFGYGDNGSQSITYRGFESQNFLSYKTRALSTIAVGYQLNVFEGENFGHRSILQFSRIQRTRWLTLGHRVRSDHTFARGTAPRFRARYRLGSEIPLQGENLDPTELYLFLSDEVIGALRAGNTTAENRLTVMAGYFTKSKDKFQLGIDWRTVHSTTGSFGFLWTRIAYVASIN